jgi:anti-anti-sigma factor
MWLGSAYHPLVRRDRERRYRPRNRPRTSRPAPRGRIEIAVDAGPETTTVFIRGELDLVTMPFLAEQLTTVLEKMPGRLVLDLSRTGFVDCGSARLLAATGRSLPAGQRPVIRRPSPGVRRIFELTGLDADCEIEA